MSNSDERARLSLGYRDYGLPGARPNSSETCRDIGLGCCVREVLYRRMRNSNRNAN